MTPEETREIVARELYVHTAPNARVYAVAKVRAQATRRRERWYRRLSELDRQIWRERADRLVESLAESGIVAPEEAP